jgi:putative phosphoribosyl transferase
MSNLRVISHSGEPFRDRSRAGQLLAEQLGDLRGKKAVILGIPRGGIVVAKEIALVLEADLDIVLARKLGTPGEAELAMGSVSEDGKIFLNENVVRSLGITGPEIEEEKARQLQEIQRRSRIIRSALPKTPLVGRIVVVTDDGAATGATMQAALQAVRQEKPQKLIAAIPVASEEALERLSADADEIICLRQPLLFMAVGQFYRQFYQVQDEEVVQMLADEARRRKNRITEEK